MVIGGRLLAGAEIDAVLYATRRIRVVPKSVRRQLATYAVYDTYGGVYEERMNYPAVDPGDVAQK